MYFSEDKDYPGYSHAKYLENDPVKYDFNVSQRIITKDHRTQYHDDVELFFVIEGEANLTVNGESSRLSAGNLVLLMPYHVHSLKLISANMSIFHCHISLGLILFSSISRTIEKHVSYSLAYGNVATSLSEEEQKQIHRLFDELIKETSEEDPLNKMIGLSILIRIILQFTRSIANTIKSGEPFDGHTMRNLMHYVNMNFNTNLTAKKIADELAISPLKVNSYFYQLTGESLSTILHQTRIRYACCMLQFDQLSITYIGKYVGYRNMPSFFRKFKEIKKMTPDEYRKSHIPDDAIHKNLNTAWKILLYLYEHYVEPIDEEFVSKALFLSAETIQTELYSNFDISLSDLITEIRLQYARTFLQVYDAPIVKVSYLSGFSSVRTFNRCFQNAMGCTPTEFRKKHAIH